MFPASVLIISQYHINITTALMSVLHFTAVDAEIILTTFYTAG